MEILRQLLLQDKHVASFLEELKNGETAQLIQV